MSTEVISHFKEKPKTQTAWRAFGFGIGTIFVFPFMGFFSAVLMPLMIRSIGDKISLYIGILIAVLVLFLSVFALIYGIRAFKKGERSWVMWVGFVPATIVCIMWVFFIIGEIFIPH